MYRLSEYWTIGETSGNGGEGSLNYGSGEFKDKRTVCLNSPVTPKRISGGCITSMIEEAPVMAKIIPFPNASECTEIPRVQGPMLTIGRHHYRIRPHSLVASVWRWMEELWEE